jgi:hypothetical protein
MTTPFVDPQSLHNPATGTSPPASWGDAVRDGVVFCATPPSCRANRTTTQSIADITSTAVSFTAADSWDTDSFHSTVSNQSRLTVPSGLGGKYLIVATANWANNSTGWRNLRIRANGSTDLATAGVGTGTANPYPISTITTVEQLAAGTYIEVTAWQNSGAALDITAANVTIMQVSL